MADNIGVLGSSTALIVGTATVYTCPANKAAKFRIMGSWQSGVSTTLQILVNNVTVTTTAGMSSGNYTYTNGGAGLLSAPGATAPNGQGAATTVQPAPPIYYLSAGQTVQYIIGAAAMLASNCQVVGVEIDLTP